MIGVVLLSIITSFLIWGIMTVYKKQQFFKEINVKHFKPNFFFGNTFEVLMGWIHSGEKLNMVYRAFPEEEVVGYYDIIGPQIVVRSPDVVDAVLVQNFSNFHDRPISTTKIEGPDDANLLSLGGNAWRALRYKFSPLFTSGKLKFMYHSMAECGTTLVSVLENREEEEIEMSEVMGLFATDVIGSTVFGIEANLLRNPKSEFRAMAKKIFAGSLKAILRMAIFIVFPKLTKILGISVFSGQKEGDYFYDVVRKTIAERMESGRQRNDFVQMLLQLKQKGRIEVQIHDSGDDFLLQDNANDTFELEITDDVLVGGAFTFFAAGFHATALTLTYALFELSQHPEAEARVREEIAAIVQGEDPTYEDLRKMRYLECAIKETLRLHPVAPAIGRVCNKEYTTPGGFVFKPGYLVGIPIWALQTDPAYWPDPLAFNPDRFMQDEPPKPGTYLPFGGGPRICIAMRFAMMEVKLGLVKLLMKYKLELSEKTKLPLKISPRMFLLTPADGIHFRVKKLKHEIN